VKKKRPKAWETMTPSQWREKCHLWEAVTLYEDSQAEILRAIDSSRILRARFVVPELYCPPGNRRDSMHWSRAAELRKRCYRYMLEQHNFRIRDEPLTGKPVVVCVRFTSTPTDTRSNWDKFPVDSLRVPRVVGQKHWLGLGYINDDGPNDIDLHAWCAKGPVNGGFVYVRVYE
jgi:hypothetical protein